MQTDFAAVRELLERAQDKLCGSDETSRKARETLDVLVEVVAAAEYRRPPAQVVPFPQKARW